jgi:hypothetical protein
MHPAFRYFLAAFVGGAVGYLGLFILANVEDWQFYTIRSLVTGKIVMSEIVEHPADGWVAPVLFVTFISIGSALGILTARRLRRADSP